MQKSFVVPSLKNGNVYVGKTMGDQLVGIRVVPFFCVLRPGQTINVGRSNTFVACWTVQHVEN